MISFANDWSPAFCILHMVCRLLNLFSLFCGAAIVTESLADMRHSAATSTSRIICAEILSSMFFGVSFLVGSLAQPVDSGVWGAFGNHRTCSIQGFCVIFGSTAFSLYDSSLGITFLLLVKYRWTTKSLRRLEIFFHVLAVGVSLLFSVALLHIDGFGTNGKFTCYVQDIHADCEQSPDLPACVRGLRAESLRQVLALLHILSLPTSAACMIVIYCSVRRQEERNAAYTAPYEESAVAAPGSTLRSSIKSTTTPGRRNTLSRQVAIEGLLYTTTVYFTLLPVALVQLVSFFTGVYNPILYAISLTISSPAAIYHIIIFVRRRKEMRTAFGRLSKRMVVACLKGVRATWLLPVETPKSRTESTPPTQFTTSSVDMRQSTAMSGSLRQSGVSSVRQSATSSVDLRQSTVTLTSPVEEEPAEASLNESLSILDPLQSDNHDEDDALASQSKLNMWSIDEVDDPMLHLRFL